MNDPTDKTSTRLRLGRVAPDARPPPPSLPQFSHVTRYWDQEHGCYAARLLPGEYYVTTQGENVCTVLGSCVSACIRDARLHIGGMNHFMLPLDGSNGESAWGSAVSAATRYGNVAMEMLINDILKLGGRRKDLEIKLVGGGRVLTEMSNDVGSRNIDFVRRYVREEGFRVLNEDLGDVFPRRVVYFPESGRLRVRKLNAGRDEILVAQERSYLKRLDTRPVEGDIELF
ncbi:MAG TPA: chemoreceptor glutamine deamidase CheD [Steroidobacteraceae bacterium]|jgi:chemotaxis protein CheD|nr:chemoreceptor glutamine deamidase CheD [Steroidobacteraceae bacterium]